MPSMLRLVRGALVFLIAGIVIFIGGVVALAASAVPVGGVLLGLGILSVLVALVLMVRFNARARANSADAEARWQAVRDGNRPR
jgi:Zn-dependent membrane protease YugP